MSFGKNLSSVLVSWIFVVCAVWWTFEVKLVLAAEETAEPPRHKPPKISDEEEFSLASKFRCPACTAIVWELEHALTEAEISPARPLSKAQERAALGYSEVLDVM